MKYPSSSIYSSFPFFSPSRFALLGPYLGMNIFMHIYTYIYIYSIFMYAHYICCSAWIVFRNLSSHSIVLHICFFFSLYEKYSSMQCFMNYKIYIRKQKSSLTSRERCFVENFWISIYADSKILGKTSYCFNVQIVYYIGSRRLYSGGIGHLNPTSLGLLHLVRIPGQGNAR